jgi:predicted dehydrogenase
MKTGRRAFLRAAAGAPLVVPASTLGRGATASPGNRITVGCIGVGWMGSANVSSFLDEADAQVVAVCDVDSEHLEEARALVNAKYQNKDCATYRHFEELLARPDIDAVMLAVPDHWHGVLSIAAAKAGKDIYGEKPIAGTFLEGKAICDAVTRYRRVWQAGTWQRSRAQFRTACELVRNGRIGRVHTVEVGLPGGLTDFDGLGHLDQPAAPPKQLDYERWLGPAPDAPYCAARVHKTWRWNLDYGGGMLMDWVGHHVDIAHWGLGFDNEGPVSVEARGEYSLTNAVWNAPSKFHVTAKYRSGVTMHIRGGDEDVRRGAKWIGDDGWLWVDRNGMDAQPRQVLFSRIRPDEVHLPVSPGHHRNFLDCVKSRGTPIAPAPVALRSTTPGYLGLISILTGSKIAWDPEKQQIIGNPAAERWLSRPLRGPWRLS